MSFKDFLKEERRKKTAATLILHGKVEHRKEDAKFAQKVAKAHGGRTETMSFWNHRTKSWHSPDTEGKVAHRIMVPINKYDQALKAAKAHPTETGLKFSHSWGNWDDPSPKTRKKK